MQLVRWLVLFASFSLLTITNVACNSGPRVSICLIDPIEHKLDCADPDGKGFSVPLDEAQSYVCFSDDDLRVLLNRCRQKGL